MTSAQSLIKTVFGEDPTGVDPVKIAHHLGLQVMEAPLGGEICGSLIKENPDETPMIVIDSGCSYGRKRFICARLIAFYANLYQGLDEFEHFDFYKNISSQKDINSFAVQLLMPEKELARLLSVEVSAVELALNFSLPKEYVSWYLNTLTN